MCKPNFPDEHNNRGGTLHIQNIIQRSASHYVTADEEPKTEHKLQILAEAMAYANRLQMHVEKENNVVYPLADRSLPENIKEKIDKTVKDFEKEEDPAFVKGYLDLLDRLEKKYHIA